MQAGYYGTPLSIPGNGTEARYFTINVGTTGSFIANGIAVVSNPSGTASSGYCFVEGDDVHDRRAAILFTAPAGGQIVNVPVSASTTLVAAGPISISCLVNNGNSALTFFGGTLNIIKVATLH